MRSAPDVEPHGRHPRIGVQFAGWTLQHMLTGVRRVLLASTGLVLTAGFIAGVLAVSSMRTAIAAEALAIVAAILLVLAEAGAGLIVQWPRESRSDYLTREAKVTKARCRAAGWRAHSRALAIGVAAGAGTVVSIRARLDLALCVTTVAAILSAAIRTVASEHLSMVTVRADLDRSETAYKDALLCWYDTIGARALLGVGLLAVAIAGLLSIHPGWYIAVPGIALAAIASGGLVVGADDECPPPERVDGS
jgi:hypothetical protein